MSTQENPVPLNLAHLLVELSQNIEKREQFRRNPSPFLANNEFNPKEIEALLSRDSQAVRQAFGLSLGHAGLDAHEDFIREIVRDEIKKAKKKKPSKKKDKAEKKKKKK
ncbi:MAG TPA: hypothetical protein VGK48_19710 [Terriglobia bacterium]|jgi:hypothetical protein